MLTFWRVLFVFLSFKISLMASVEKVEYSGFFAKAEHSSVHFQSHEELLERTLEAVSKVVDFFAREYKNFNIDGMFGLQALDGILQDLLTKAQSDRIQISHGTIKLLARLHDEATLTTRKAQPFLNASDPDYYRLGFVAKHPWHFKREFRSLDISLSQGSHYSKIVAFDGKTMDQCISDLIGDQKTGAMPCNITDECWRFIRSNNTQGYKTTHQALFFMVGEVKGCLPIIEERLLRFHRNQTGIIEDIFEALCASIYKEVRWKEGVLDQQQRSRNAAEKDLYMEQCYVCGILGYHEFLSLDRLSAILEWQLPPGCYGKKHGNDNLRDEGDEVKVYKQECKGLVDDASESYFSTGRSRRRTNSHLPGGCQRHITGVATGVLGVYIKWLLTFPPLEHILM